MILRKKKKTYKASYDSSEWKPILKCSICTGEQVAGFKNIRTGEFREESFISGPEALQRFMNKYQLDHVGKEY